MTPINTRNESFDMVLSFFIRFSIEPNGLASRQIGPLLAFFFQFSIFRAWSKKPSSSNFRPVEAIFCWGFVLFSGFGRAWPFAGLGFQPLRGFYLTCRRKATWKQSARRVCFGHASVGQSTKLTTTAYLPSTSS